MGASLPAGPLRGKREGPARASDSSRDHRRAGLIGAPG